MRYVLLVYETPGDFASRTPAESEQYVAAWRAYHQAMIAAGVHVPGGIALKDAGTATTVRIKGGQRYVQDGPFAESKEQLGGFLFLECESLDVALEWAARCPTAATGVVEVRPIDLAIHETIVDG
jgi:hypothetical protein